MATTAHTFNKVDMNSFDSQKSMDYGQQVGLEKGLYYWVETGGGEFYLPCKLLYDVKDSVQELTLEVYGTRAVLQAPQTAVMGLIPPPANITLEKNFNDLVAAVDISEPAILWNLKMRFKRNEIYSAIGPILIAVNPYKRIDCLYSSDTMKKYLHFEKKEPEGSLGTEEPHIWSIAKSSYEQLLHSGTRQAIIVSGESGAGKTEATKQCLQFLSSVSHQDRDINRDAIEERVLDTNPLLESFGNAKTSRNNNSSRFGKWLEIRFQHSHTHDSHLELVGAKITQYLLEKSRVVAQANDERSYHIFYQMCTYPAFDLGCAENFRFLSLSGATEIAGVDDGKEFVDTLKSFDDLKFSDADRSMIFDSLRAILHMGNIIFENGDAAKIPNSGLARMAITEASSLLQIDSSVLEFALVERTLEVRGEKMNVPMSETAASDSRNALCKEIYGRLFCQIVLQANLSLSVGATPPPKASGSNIHRAGDIEANLSIGLLDIFGFEIFISNSFEQLCINYANEKLQQYFIEFVLKKEQDIYDTEGIVFDRITPMDNLDVLSMIESKQGGIFVLLDEELKIPKGSDLGYLKKVEAQQASKSSGRFRRDFRMPPELFEIKHFAGTVMYNVTNFMEKNRDKMHEHLEDLLMTSSSERFKATMTAHGPRADIAPVAGLGSPAPVVKSSQSSATIVSRFSKQLVDLMNLLGASQPHFVKCVKPNNTKSANFIDTDLVLRQLRYSGVLEAVKIRKSGYPVRMKHSEFQRVYRVISRVRMTEFVVLDDRQACELIISRLASRSEVYKSIIMGRSLVFYRPEASNAMETERFDIGYRALIYLQARRRKHICAARVKKLSDARNSLRASIVMGEMYKSCNTDAILPLEKFIKHCEDIGMICYIIKSAHELLSRLKRVQKCKEKLSGLVDSYNTFDDIVLYFNEMKSCLEDARSFNLESPLIRIAETYLENLKNRVDALMDLRDAVKLQDDEILSSCIDRVANLSKEHGAYCSKEEEGAALVFSLLRKQLGLLDDCLDVISASQNSISADDSSDSVCRIIELDLPSLDENLNVLLKEPPESQSGTIMLKVLQLIIEMRLCWMKKKWSDVAEKMRYLRQQCQKSIDADSKKVSSRNIDRVKRWQIVANAEVAIVVEDMDVHYFLPKIMSAWTEMGDIPTEVAAGDEELYYKKLSDTMTEITSIGWLGSKLSTMFPLLETALNVKKSFSLDEPELLLALTESEEETKSRLLRRNELVDVFNTEELMEDFSAIKIDAVAPVATKSSRRSSIQLGNFVETSQSLSESSLNPTRRHTLMDKSSPNISFGKNSSATEVEDVVSDSVTSSVHSLSVVFGDVSNDNLKSEEKSRPVPPPPPRRPTEIPAEIVNPPPPPPPPPRRRPPEPSRDLSVPPPPPTRNITAVASPLPPPPKSVLSSTSVETTSTSPHVHSTSMKNVMADQSVRRGNIARMRIPAYPPIENELLKQRKTMLDIDKIIQSLTGRFRDAALVIRNDIIRIRRIALERYCQMILTEAVQFGSIQGSSGKLRLDKGSIAGLSKTLAEIKDILKDTVPLDAYTASIREIGSNLLFLRKSILESAFESIVKAHAKGQLDVVEPLGISKSRIQNIFFQMAKAEIALIVSEASNEWFSRKLSSVLQVGSVRGDVGKIKAKEIGYKEIEDIISMIRTSKEIRGEHGFFVESLQQLIDFAKALIMVRKSFQEDNFSNQKKTFEFIENTFSSYPPIALKEMAFIKKNIKYGDALSQLTTCLTLPESFSYFKPLSPSVSLIPKDQDDSIHELLNKQVVDVDCLGITLLLNAIGTAENVVLDVGLYSLPQSFQNLLKAARCILKIRQSVATGKWDEADDQLTFIREKHLLTSVPIIQNEFHLAVQAVDAKLVISVCENALANDFLKINSEFKGEFDLSNVKTESLDRAIDICVARGCRTKASAHLFKAVSVVQELRRAALSNDWGTLKSIILKVKNEKLESSQLPKCTADEITAARVVIMNEEISNALIQALTKEAINLHHGKLPEPRYISTTAIRNALNASTTLDKEHQGQKVENLIIMSQCVQQCREGLKQSAWRDVASNLPVFFKCINMLKRKDTSQMPTNEAGVEKLLKKGSSDVFVSSDSSTLNTFIAIMEKEYNLLNDYIAMTRIEVEALHELSENGFSEECVGMSETAMLDTSGLQKVLDQLLILQDSSPLSLTRSLSDIGIALNLVKEIRASIILDDWKKVKDTILEATAKETFDDLPEPSKREITAVKHEIENREMIASLTAALNSGKLVGDVDQPNLESISCKALEIAIRDCKLMVIKTEEAGCLMYSAMQILRLRQYLLERPTPWGKLKVYASGLLTNQQLSKLHVLAIPEIRLIHGVVVDNVLCKNLTDALTTGNPSGPPGKMNCNGVSTTLLERACHEAVLSINRTERAEQLVRCCKFFLSMREMLMHIELNCGNRKACRDSWVSIGGIVSEIFLIGKSNALDAGWSVCKTVISAISKEVLIQDCLYLLQESVDNACLTYSTYSQLSLSAEESNSVIDRIETRSLEVIIQKCTDSPESTSLYLNQLLCAIVSLKLIREHVNRHEWTKIKKMARSQEFLSQFQNCAFAVEEIHCAYQDAYNAEIVGSIHLVLNRPFQFSLSFINEEAEEALLSENLLNDVIRRAESADISYVSAQQLLECSQQLLHLRVAMRTYDVVSVQKVLRWFQSNGHICPKSIVCEVEKSERLYRSSVATRRLIDSLSTGSAKRRGGVLDLSTVDTTNISEALDHARQIKDPTEDLIGMIRVGELLYCLRYAQCFQTEDDVKIAVDNIMAADVMLHSCAVEEVSEARADVGNKAAISILTNALRSFKPTGSIIIPSYGEVMDDVGNSLMIDADFMSKSPFLASFLKNNTMPPVSPTVNLSTPRPVNKKQVFYKQMSREGENTSFFADPASAVALEVALAEAENHGIFSVEAKKLKRTTLFVLSLRYAIEADDWFRVEEILGEYDKKSTTRRKSYIQLVDVAAREIQYIRMQLQVMSALVTLGKNLKSGWAACSNGIVDVTGLLVEPLHAAISKTEESIHEFDVMEFASSVDENQHIPNNSLVDRSGTMHESKAAIDGKLEKESIRRLLTSAKEIYKIRKFLSIGEISAAASNAERVLQSKPHVMIQAELQLYYVEIGRALHMMRLCRSLRGSMRLGNVEALETTIFEAQQASMQMSGDLGLVRTLEKAVDQYRSIIKAHSYLKCVATGHDAGKIEAALEMSRKLNMSGALVDRVRGRLNSLKRFETSVERLTSSVTPETNLLRTQEMVFQLASLGDMQGHPIAQRAAILMRLSSNSLQTALLAEAIFGGSAHLASCETLTLRKYYLRQHRLKTHMNLKDFSGFRDPENFATRMMLDAQELHMTMLQHTDGHISTSLTNLSPTLAALAVWIFRHCIRAIEEYEYSHPEVILRNLVTLGRFSIHMRDEIIAQLMKQLTSNLNDINSARLWLVLLCCLEHFPPSSEFEAYVEHFLISEMQNNPPQSDVTNIISQCRVALHESVFKYGYNNVINGSWDNSLKTMSSSMSLKFRTTNTNLDNSIHCSSAIQPAIGRNNRRNSIATDLIRLNTQGDIDKAMVADADGQLLKNKLQLELSNSEEDRGMTNRKVSAKPSSRARRNSTMALSSLSGSFSKWDVKIEDTQPFFDGNDCTNVYSTKFEERVTESFESTQAIEIVVEKRIRGTRENWRSRFQLLSDGLSYVTFELFLIKFRNNFLDARDKEIFLFLMHETPPKKRNVFSRELNGIDSECLELDADENQISFQRQRKIVQLFENRQPLLKKLTYDAAVKKFWNEYIEAFSVCEDDSSLNGIDWLLYRDLVIGGIRCLLADDSC